MGSEDLISIETKDRDLVTGEDVAFEAEGFTQPLDLILEMNVGSKVESIICKFKCSGLVLRANQSGSKRRHMVMLTLACSLSKEQGPVRLWVNKGLPRTMNFSPLGATEVRPPRGRTNQLG